MTHLDQGLPQHRDRILSTRLDPKVRGPSAGRCAVSANTPLSDDRLHLGKPRKVSAYQTADPSGTHRAQR